MSPQVESKEDVSMLERPDTEGLTSGDRAQREFSTGSLRAQTNQIGTQNKKFSLLPSVATVSSSFAYPE